MEGGQGGSWALTRRRYGDGDVFSVERKLFETKCVSARLVNRYNKLLSPPGTQPVAVSDVEPVKSLSGRDRLTNMTVGRMDALLATCPAHVAWLGACAVVKLQMAVIRLTRYTPHTNPLLPTCRLSFSKTTAGGGGAARNAGIKHVVIRNSKCEYQMFLSKELSFLKRKKNQLMMIGRTLEERVPHKDEQ
ncbi:hypothetical protein E2C01_076423 [Portunus trituberculatus]|uniref:Uncharacterized protein n=1 Tax=Portunus trituberculatus TaxID=210409 RepID=A0A5B7IIU2_PORTR|nr:hypothetical protein [Portunus trituberculatus]